MDPNNRTQRADGAACSSSSHLEELNSGASFAWALHLWQWEAVSSWTTNEFPSWDYMIDHFHPKPWRAHNWVLLACSYSFATGHLHTHWPDRLEFDWLEKVLFLSSCRTLSACTDLHPKFSELDFDFHRTHRTFLISFSPLQPKQSQDTNLRYVHQLKKVSNLLMWMAWAHYPTTTS